MRLPTPYVCDVCNTPKRETNHWYLGVADRHSVVVAAWDTDCAELPQYAHLCGAECALKFSSAKIREMGNPDEQNTATTDLR